MAIYQLQLSIATACSHESGWSFAQEPIEKEDFQDPIVANEKYDMLKLGMNITAAEHNMAVSLQLVRVEGDVTETIRSTVYDGENVLGWKVAFHKEGVGPEERFYIDTIHTSCGYYFFIHKKDNTTPYQVVQVGSDINELKNLLGEEFSKYEVLT